MCDADDEVQELKEELQVVTEDRDKLETQLADAEVALDDAEAELEARRAAARAVVPDPLRDWPAFYKCLHPEPGSAPDPLALAILDAYVG